MVKNRAGRTILTTHHQDSQKQKADIVETVTLSVTRPGKPTKVRTFKVNPSRPSNKGAYYGKKVYLSMVRLWTPPAITL